MVGTIGRLGQRRNAVTAAVFLVGLLVGASLFGAALSIGGAWLPGLGSPVAVALALVVGALLSLCATLSLVRFPRLYRATQVNARWQRQFGRVPAHLGFGVVLGVGVLTYPGKGFILAPAAAAIAAADPGVGAIIYGAYGLGRGMSIIVDIVRGVGGPTMLWGFGRTHLLARVHVGILVVILSSAGMALTMNVLA